MRVSTRQFNIYLALAVLAGLAAGCQTDPKTPKSATLRVHIESGTESTGTTQQISLPRAAPVLVTINRDPILSEAYITGARVMEARGGFALQIQFDEHGTWLLEHYSAISPGNHFVIFGQWSDNKIDSRWLGAPLISRRISNGMLSFTPDCSREEADRLVTGLGYVANKNQKKSANSFP
jgi:hypothetical protein